MKLEYTLPALGEGINKGVVVNIAVSAGSSVAFDDTLLEIETDKAVLPVPSPSAGIIISVLVKTGDTISVGQLIAIIETDNSVQPQPAELNTITLQESKQIQRPSVTSLAVQPDIINTSKSDMSFSQSKKLPASSIPSIHPIHQPSNDNVLAGPATRKFAREMGIELSLVKGSKKGGRIDIEDIKQYVKSRMSSSASFAREEIAPLPDFGRFGEITREPLSNLRKTIAKNLIQSWSKIPHVFQFQEVDISELSSLKNRHHAQFKEQGSTASITVFIIKALAQCLHEFPRFNASYDEISQELVLKKYYHIGVAVDTEAGLIVPVIRNVEQLSIFEIGKKLRELAQKAKIRKLSLDELQGSSITLSNLGGIGGTHFTPIINPPEVAILGVGSEMIQPRYQNGTFIPRTILPICLSYDHRVIDGADAARFIVRLTQIMESFESLLLGDLSSNL